jgi:hypothetical protein
MGEGKQLSGHNFVEAVDASNAVTQGDDRAYFIHRNLGFVVLDLLPDQLRDLVCSDLCHRVRFNFLVMDEHLALSIEHPVH